MVQYAVAVKLFGSRPSRAGGDIPFGRSEPRLLNTSDGSDLPLYKLTATDQGRRAWYVVWIRPERETEFLRQCETGGTVPLLDYGDILTSGWAEGGGEDAGMAYALQKVLPKLPADVILERAARILNGGTKPSDYLSPVVVEKYGRGTDPALGKDVRAAVQALAHEQRYPLSTTDEQRLTTDFMLRRFYAPKSVLCRRTDEGALVLAVGFDQIGPVFNHLSADRLRGFVVEFLDDSF